METITQTISIDDVQQMHELVLNYQETILGAISALKMVHPCDDAQHVLKELEKVVEVLPYDYQTTFSIDLEYVM